MIFEILTHKSDGTKMQQTVFQEKGYGEAWDAFDLFRSCGFTDGFVCCADGYQNGLIFKGNDSQPS